MCRVGKIDPNPNKNLSNHKVVNTHSSAATCSPTAYHCLVFHFILAIQGRNHAFSDSPWHAVHISSCSQNNKARLMPGLVSLWFLVSKYLLQKYNHAVVLQGGWKNIQGFPPFLLSLCNEFVKGLPHWCSTRECFCLRGWGLQKYTELSSYYLLCSLSFSHLIKAYFFIEE